MDACLKHSASSESLFEVAVLSFLLSSVRLQGGVHRMSREQMVPGFQQNRKKVQVAELFDGSPYIFAAFFFLHHEEHLDFCPRPSEPIAFSDGPFYNDDALSDN